MSESNARGNRVRERAGAGTTSPALAGAKRLGLWVGVGVLGVLLGSCGIGFFVANSGNPGGLAGARNVSLMVLALFYMVQAVIWGAVYFALAWAVGTYGPYIPTALRWTGGKATVVQTYTGRIADRYIVRPLAGTTRWLTEARALAGGLSGAARESASRAAPMRGLTQELSGWSTLQNRMRWGRQALPADTAAGMTGAPPAAVAPPPAPVAQNTGTGGGTAGT